MSPSDWVAQLYPLYWVPLFVAFYNSKGYGEGILTLLHMGKTNTQGLKYFRHVMRMKPTDNPLIGKFRTVK
jgi:hypothetical protein